MCKNPSAKTNIAPSVIQYFARCRKSGTGAKPLTAMFLFIIPNNTPSASFESGRST